jgi:hypothetical protein
MLKPVLRSTLQITHPASYKQHCRAAPIYHGYSLLKQWHLNAWMILWLCGMGSWEKCNFDVAERCTLHVSWTLINEKQDFATFSKHFSI